MKLDIKEAREVLGVKEGASKDEIVRRYDVLLKKHRMNQLNESMNTENPVSLESINRAYNLLMGYDDGSSDEPAVNPNPNPLLKKMNLDERKVNNFFYYHKYHILIGIVVLITLVFTIRGCVNRVDPDFNLVFMGEFYYTDSEPLKQDIKAKVPVIKEPGIDIVTLSEKQDGQQQMAMQQKAMVLMAAGDVDVFILDKVNFERYAKQGAFESLDSLAEELKVDKEKNKDFKVKVEDKPEPYLYGIDVSSSSLIKDIKATNGKVAAIRVNTKHRDKAVEFLKTLLK